jgi:hypothetical protein
MNRFWHRFQGAALLLVALSFVGQEASSRGETVSGLAPTRVAHGDTVRSDTVRVPAPAGETKTDRANVQAAFDAVGPSDVVRFGPGPYYLGAGAQLTAPDVTVLGHPEGTTLRGCDPATFDRKKRLPLVFDCTGLHVQTRRQTIQGLTFEHVWHGVIVGPYPTSAEEARAVLQGESSGPEPYPAGGHRIEGNTFRASINGLRVLGTGEEESVVRDNDFIDVYHAAGIYGAPLRFLGNRVTVEQPERVPRRGHPGSAILIGARPDCSGHVVANNRVEGYPGAIYVLAYNGTTCRDAEIRDNTIEVRPVTLPETGAPAPTDEDSTMVGVPITLAGLGESSPGLPKSEAEGVVENIVVEGNRLLGAEGLGILVDGSRNRIAGNTITGIRRREPFPGITWIGSEHTTWEAANGSGIWISPDSDHNEVAGNVFEDIAGAAVLIEGDSTRVELESADDTVGDRGAGTRVTRPPENR